MTGASYSAHESAKLTAAEIAEVMGASKRAMNKRAEKEGWPHEQGTNRARRYPLTGLPADVQRAIFDKQYRIGVEEPFDRLRVEQLAQQFKIDIPAERLEDPRTAGMVRMVCECMAIPEGAHGRRQRIKEIAEGYGFHVGSAYRLLERVKKGKPLLAKRKTHGETWDDLGITLRAWDRQAGQMAIGMIMENRRRQVDGLTLYQQVKDTAEAESLRVGCYESFMNLKKKIDASPAGTRRDKGTQGLRQDVLPAIRRDPTAYRPMECLVGDQHKADYYAFDSSGKVITLELFCWMDFRTQLVWPSIAYKHYNRYTVGQALINAVRWGLPSTVYTDWGKPEESKYLTMLRTQLIGLGIVTEQIRHDKAQGRRPQSKPIEGFFANFDRILKNRQIPGYCKRLKDNRENYLQQRELNQLIKAGGLLEMSELVGTLMEEIRAWNEHRFKNRQAPEDNGLSPLEIYERETVQFKPTGLSEEMLDYIFLPVREAMVKNSTVGFRHEWLGKKFYHDRDLADFNGCKVELRYPPFAPWYVFVIVQEGTRRKVIRVEEWDMINPKIPEHVTEKIEAQEALRKQIDSIYQKYLPPRKPVRRINPAEREARELRGQRAEGRGQTTGNVVRVLETSLERQGAQVQGSGFRVLGSKKDDALAEFRKRFHPGARKAEEEEAEYKPLFKLSMKQLAEED